MCLDGSAGPVDAVKVALACGDAFEVAQMDVLVDDEGEEVVGGDPRNCGEQLGGEDFVLVDDVLHEPHVGEVLGDQVEQFGRDPPVLLHGREELYGLSMKWVPGGLRRAIAREVRGRVCDQQYGLELLATTGG